MAKEIGCKFIETSSGLNHKVDELLVGIVAQVKLNPQRIRNLSEKQRNSLCMAMHQKMKGTSDQDHFSQLRLKERNKSNNSKEGTSISKHENEVESDDERSSDESEHSDIEKYFNLDANTAGDGGESSRIFRLLKSRRHATPGMMAQQSTFINSFFNDDRKNSNNNVSSSSCSTPTKSYPSSSMFMQTKLSNKSDSKFSYENPSSSSQPVTPKKSNLMSADESGDKCINRFSSRTKLFLTSFLKFKRTLRVKRRNSNSCSDLLKI